MSYMKEVALLIEFAGAHGVALDISDFRTIDGVLCIDGMPAEDWLKSMIDDCEYKGKDGE